MTDSVHRAASEGFGAMAAQYDRSRPDYPSGAIDRLVEELEVGPVCRLLDLGAGTGKLTRLLAGRGGRLVALEPVESMRRRLAEVVPGVPVVGATAEALPFGPERFDAVVAAQSFHWFDGDRALAEIHRVLRPHGRLGLLWNVRDESVDWVRDLTRILEPHEDNAPREHWREWRQAFAHTDGFGRLNRLRFPHEQPLDPEGLVERVASISFIAVLPEEEREAVFRAVRELAASHPDLRGRKAFSLPYQTDLYWCAKA